MQLQNCISLIPGTILYAFSSTLCAVNKILKLCFIYKYYAGLDSFKCLT